MVVPLESQSLAKVIVELEQKVLLVLRAQIEKLLAADDCSYAAKRLVGVLVRRPLDLVDLSTDDE